MIERLREEDRPAATRLLREIDRTEGLELPVDPEGDAFVWREDGEIVGLAGWDGVSEVETSGAVHPRVRRRGIGGALLRAVAEEARRNGAETVWVVADESSADGTAFAEGVGTRETAEYRMVLEGDTAPSAQAWTDPLDLRAAGIADLNTFVAVTAAAFPEHPAEAARAWLSQDMTMPNRRFWIARMNGEAVGAVRAIGFNPRVYITTLGVRPEYRGRGYGRQILARTIQTLRQEPWGEILIEVETQNANALGLYRSCGFRESRTYGFYRVRE